jgi:hypothetical protein
MLTMLEARESRRKNLLEKLAQHIGFCALYRIPEPLWKTSLPHYDRANTRAMHPGASLSGPRFTLDAIPMLHGSSGNRGPVVIKGLFATDPDHKTSFGRLLAPIPLHAWQGKNGVEPLRDARRLTAAEKSEITDLAKRKGWL